MSRVGGKGCDRLGAKKASKQLTHEESRGQVVAGSEMTMARRGAEVVVVGWNEHGNLGLGDTANRFTAAVLPLRLRGACLMAAGGGHCAALAELQHDARTGPSQSEEAAGSVQ